MARIGILALQGAFLEHARAFQQLGAETVEVRLPQQLEGLDGLVIPGGESTTMLNLMQTFRLAEPIKDRAGNGMAIFGTCAGLIYLAKVVHNSNHLGLPTLDLMDIEVKRNAFGRQVDSFETELNVPALGPGPFPGIFIRAPVIERVGPHVEALARLAEGAIVAARQGKLLITSFHPELTGDSRFHHYFLQIASASVS